MRIWDVDPGYLSRENLLGEHAELHGLVAVLQQGRQGYARHPETLRWRGCLGALAVRHGLLVAEMRLRGYAHRSPLPVLPDATRWPARYLDAPAVQLERLGHKYRTSEGGRIPIPRDAATLWAQHALSVLARGPGRHRRMARDVAAGAYDIGALARELSSVLRTPPAPAALPRALCQLVEDARVHPIDQPVAPGARLHALQAVAYRHRLTALLHATALGELAFWCDYDAASPS